MQDEIEILSDLLSFTIGSKFEGNDYTNFEYQPSGRLMLTPHARHAFWGAVSRAVSTPSRADEVLQKILEETEAQAGRAREIAGATQRQSSDLGRVQGAMRTVREIVDQIDGAAQVQQSATSEIGRTMGNIRQLGVAVKHSTEEQRRGSRLIAEAALRVAEMASQIANAIRAQASSRETIQHAMQVFDGVAQETTRGVEATHSSVATLSARAKQLEDGVERFKTR